MLKLLLRLTSLTVDIVMTYDLLKLKRGSLEINLAVIQEVFFTHQFIVPVFVYNENKGIEKGLGTLSAKFA